MSLLFPLQLHHLFPLDDEAVIYHTVPVVVAQETPFTRNIFRVRRLNQYSHSKLGDAGSRMPSWMSWEAAPPMVKKDVPSISKICPRIT